jgi:hypothetical protein
MSIEVHPNIHAVQFTMDILESIKNNLRGKAAKQPMKGDVMRAVHGDQGSNIVVNFAAEMSTMVDDVVSGKKRKEEVPEYKTLEQQIMELWKSRNLDVDLIQFRTNKKNQGVWTIKAKLWDRTGAKK